MCQFCVEHGEGKRWYLNAANYAFDLKSDLQRREYVVEFVSGFESMRSNALTWMERFDRVPAPLSRAGKAVISARQKRVHFGQPVPLEECEQILDLCTSVTVIPCICRMHAPGQRAEEVCLLVTTQPVEAILAEGFKDYQDGPDLDDFNRISKDEAMALMRACEDQGLMHSVWTFKTPFTAAICNCNIESGCMAMRLTAVHDLKVMWRGESVASIDADKCTACRRCASVCPFNAIDTAPRAVSIAAQRCWGCGICRSACHHNAITLADRRSVPEVANVW